MTTSSKVIVLDLDDTLYSEFEYLKSAYSYIAKKLSKDSVYLYQLMLTKYNNNENVFDFLSVTYDISKLQLINWYRYHTPDIQLYPDVLTFLNMYLVNSEIALVTDGRSKTQRNKIKALGIEKFFKNIVISEELGFEKPNIANFEAAITNIEGESFFYIGDNINKDFITPNKMGWMTICLKDKGCNVHKQKFDIPDEYQPEYVFESWLEILSFIETI
ncbi:HAD family hydrolase [uncultured Psychrobacter sp.]|uniref:HAD family hydrolase n=1 Tax=uncultured Psychrobacter sp. TaxID=259303 RepID=UPI002595A4A9|nr:HAD family hydrolase [uncultured Psychrobacter sp.]